MKLLYLHRLEGQSRRGFSFRGTGPNPAPGGGLEAVDGGRLNAPATLFLGKTSGPLGHRLSPGDSLGAVLFLRAGRNFGHTLLDSAA